MKNRLFLTLTAAAAMTAAAGMACTIMAAEAETAEAAAEQPEADTAENVIVSCDKFSVAVPGDIAKISETETAEDSIRFYETISHETGAGFVGSIALFADVKDYCNIPNFRRGGEIRYEDGTKLDIVIEYPSDVQFDFNSEESTGNYDKIRDAFDEIIAPSLVAEGGAFVPQSEVDNTLVYDEILKKLSRDLEEKKDQAGLEEDGFSYLYALGYADDEDPLNAFGYTFVDLNGTGYPQLAIMKNDGTAIVYDLFSQEDGEAKHLLSSAERDYFTLTGHEDYGPSALHEHASGGADLSEDSMYIVDPMTNELFLQAAFLYNGRDDAENPFSIQYNSEETPEIVTEEDWNQRMENFGEDKLFTLLPLASVTP